jgi:hypothetical protein
VEGDNDRSAAGDSTGTSTGTSTSTGNGTSTALHSSYGTTSIHHCSAADVSIRGTATTTTGLARGSLDGLIDISSNVGGITLVGVGSGGHQGGSVGGVGPGRRRYSIGGPQPSGVEVLGGVLDAARVVGSLAFVASDGHGDGDDSSRVTGGCPPSIR